MHSPSGIYVIIVLMIDDVFAVIADPTRRQILRTLSSGQRAVGDLVDELEVSQPTVSKHLKVLRTAGLVETQAAGQKRYYSLTPAPLAKVSLWIESLSSADEQTNASPESVEQIPESPLLVAQAASVEKTAEDTGTDLAEDSEPTAEAEVPENREEPQQAEPSERSQFDMGAEGGPYVSHQPRHSSAAISFSPLKPFVPQPFTPLKPSEKTSQEALPGKTVSEEVPKSSQSAEPGIHPEPEAETPRETNLSLTPQEDTAGVEQKDSELEEVEAPAASALDADEHGSDGLEEEPHVAESSPESSPHIQELPGLPTAAEQDGSRREEEHRGLFATLSRWGRRRSR